MGRKSRLKRLVEHKAKMVRKSIERESVRRGIVECRKGMENPLADNVCFVPKDSTPPETEEKITPLDEGVL